ncbi:MAG: hypothetical protein QXL22_05300 [Candidatus Nezhaarchaeales archaeon]
MKSKIAGIVTSLLVVMLVLGVSYALWSANLYVSGVVNTGTLSVAIEAGDGYDTEPEEKDVSCISAYVEGDTMYVTINNAYPCITYTQEFNVTNTGTIPVIVQSITFEGNASEWVTVSGISVGDQIEPEEEVMCYLIVHLDNSAEQGETYTFTVTILFVQWNEFVAPGE